MLCNNSDFKLNDNCESQIKCKQVSGMSERAMLKKLLIYPIYGQNHC